MSQRNRPSQRASTSQRAGPSQRSQQIVSDESSDEGSHDGMADNEKHAYVQHACKYILSMTRKLVPIKPGDLIKSCFNGDKKLHTKIFPIVTNLLAEVSSPPTIDQLSLGSLSTIYFHLSNSCTVWNCMKSLMAMPAKSFIVHHPFNRHPSSNSPNSSAPIFDCVLWWCHTSR